MSLLLVSFIFLMVVWFIYNYFKRKRFNEMFDKLPSLPSLPILGHLLYFRNLDGLFALAYDTLEEKDGLVAFKICPMLKYVFTSDRDFVARLCTSSKVRKSNLYKIFENFLGKTLFTTNGDQWKRYKTILATIFHIDMMKGFLQPFYETTDVLIEGLKTKVENPIDIYHYVELWSLDAVLQSISGMVLEVQRNSKSGYVGNIHEVLRIISDRMSNPLKYIDFLYLFTRDYWKERKCAKFLNGYTKKVLKEKIATMNGITQKHEELSYTAGKRKKAKTVIDYFLDTRSEMTDEEICNHLNGAIFAGHDTAATATACCLFLLSKHEDIQEKLFCEIRDICGDDKRTRTTFEDLQKMTYLEMVIKESMRLYPPAPFIAKYAMEDIEHNGRVIPKGSEVIILISSLHMREKYFPKPHVFNPDRFDPEKHDVTPFTYIPFGAGPRLCIGNKAGMLLMKTGISMFLRNYKLLPVKGFQMKMVPHMVQKPVNEGIQVILTERKY